MGARESWFRNQLERAGLSLHPLGHKKSAASTHFLPEQARTEIAALYRRLDGSRGDRDYRAGSWEKIRCLDGLIIEFDEALHFNRYRLLTLDLPWAERIPWSDAYAGYSRRHEDQCLRDGKTVGWWGSTSSDKMFGGSAPPGDLSGKGSSRWKQRALYDAVRDAYALCTSGTGLARVSIHDRLGSATIQQLFKSGQGLKPSGLQDLIESRTVAVG